MISDRVKSNISKLIIYIINTVLAFIILWPILHALSVSLMAPSQVFEYPPRVIPSPIYLHNYVKAFKTAPIHLFILNSLIMSFSITLGQLITTSLAAFAFVFIPFKRKELLFMIVLSTLMIPTQTTIVANYLTVSSLGWTDSYKALIIPYLTSAFGVFALRQSFLSLPKELHEAAIIDGCSNFRFLTSIVIPLSKPALGSLGIYTFINAWNMYLWPLLITNTDTLRTVQIGIGMLLSEEVQSMGAIMAGIIMVLVPSILAFVLGQEQLVEGLTAGAVKS